jgi:LytS/YehU family sensor histidine kinase
MLRELVTYLRAAIPQIHDATSTLAKEIGLASAYLNVIDGRTREHLRVHHEVSVPLAAARVPPMVMLPLLSHALARRGGSTLIDECFEVSAAVSGDRLRVTIADPAGGLTPAGGTEEPIRYMRERLATLYGSRASLTLRALGRGSAAVIELPYEAC